MIKTSSLALASTSTDLKAQNPKDHSHFSKCELALILIDTQRAATIIPLDRAPYYTRRTRIAGRVEKATDGALTLYSYAEAFRPWRARMKLLSLTRVMTVCVTTR